MVDTLGRARPVMGKIIAGLVLSVLGLTAVPGIGSLGGLILGYSARHDLRRYGGTSEERYWVRWGILLGWLGIAIGLGICLFGSVLLWGIWQALESLWGIV